MGFLPIVNQGGKRVVRWHWLVLLYLPVISATLFGSCTMQYLLTGDWRDGVPIGIYTGVLFGTMAITRLFRTPVEKLPPAP